MELTHRRVFQLLAKDEDPILLVNAHHFHKLLYPTIIKGREGNMILAMKIYLWRGEMRELEDVLGWNERVTREGPCIGLLKREKIERGKCWALMACHTPPQVLQ